MAKLRIILALWLFCAINCDIALCMRCTDSRRRSCTWDLLPFYNNLHTEHLTSYTNTSQLIGYQHFNQCKMLPNLLTRNLHTPHAATRHKHGRAVSQHRGAEKSVAPTDFPTSQWRTIHRIRQNQLRDGGDVMCKMYAGVCKIL